jgi:excisionase family DNA binding protein
MSPKIEKLLYSRREAAAALGVCLPTLDSIVRRGELKPRKVGARILFTPAELQRFAGDAQ